MSPFHITAQALRKAQLRAETALAIFDVRSGAKAPPAENPKDGRARWRQSDVKRAIAAAEQAELGSYRIEIAPDGTIAIIVGDPADTADPAPGRDLSGDRPGV